MADESRKKVLVIEDEPSIRNNIMLMLKVERYAATGAENGRVGLELARRDPPDLILCDVMMPDSWHTTQRLLTTAAPGPSGSCCAISDWPVSNTAMAMTRVI